MRLQTAKFAVWFWLVLSWPDCHHVLAHKRNKAVLEFRKPSPVSIEHVVVRLPRPFFCTTDSALLISRRRRLDPFPPTDHNTMRTFPHNKGRMRKPILWSNIDLMKTLKRAGKKKFGFAINRRNLAPFPSAS